MYRLITAALTTALVATLCGCTSTGTREQDVATLGQLHERVLNAHRTSDVDGWMATEGSNYVSANRGRISFPSAAERREGRAGYLEASTFTTYRDLRPPLIQTSADGTLGWVIVEVEMIGTQISDTGVESPIGATWAWIELYEKQAGAWKAVGNVSNERPPAP